MVLRRRHQCSKDRKLFEGKREDLQSNARTNPLLSLECASRCALFQIYFIAAHNEG